MTIGFAVLAAGATVAFERATGALTETESIPWTVAAAAFPVALSAGLILASRLARGVGAARPRVGITALTTSALFLAAAGFGLFPDDLGQLASDPLGPERSVLILHLVALVAAVGAGFLTFRKGYATQHLPKTSYEPVKEHSVIPTLPAWLTACARSDLGVCGGRCCGMANHRGPAGRIPLTWDKRPDDFVASRPTKRDHR